MKKTTPGLPPTKPATQAQTKITKGEGIPRKQLAQAQATGTENELYRASANQRKTDQYMKEAVQKRSANLASQAQAAAERKAKIAAATPAPAPKKSSRGGLAKL